VTDIDAVAANALRLDNPALIVGILAAGVALLFLWPRAGRRWMTTVFLAFWFVSSPAGSSLLLAPLARGFHPIRDASEAQSAGAIVVLGGGIRDLKVGPDAFAYPRDSTTLRALEAARVFRLAGGRPPVVVSGGRTAARRLTTEATVMADILATLGVPRDHILLEERSASTHDQAIYVTRLLESRGIGRFIIVTSPMHMWRSQAAFRAQNVDVVPSTAPLLSDFAPKRTLLTPNYDSIDISDQIVHEYVGIVYYWARGWFRPVGAAGRR
jgi:uncharacterized SAM-binding protein YcdF (DUF218 family)